MVCTIPYGKLQEIWAVFAAMQLFFYSVLVCSADFEILHSGLFSHYVKFYILCLRYMISSGVVVEMVSTLDFLKYGTTGNPDNNHVLHAYL